MGGLSFYLFVLFGLSAPLADVAPHLLSPELATAVASAKAAAIQRQAIDAEILAHLLFSSEWPTVRPTLVEAEMPSSVRSRVAALVGIDVLCTNAQSVLARYDELLARNSSATSDLPVQPHQTSFMF
ncbi:MULTISPECIES: hypothetical protein [unclassified Caballeronia]|uniref:hypothetical protein n=1 Tax=unclassified Caballeronia TaxID=2646786 RepID=UPI001F393AF6|nr:MULTISPECIES: hypothetical protein [unclassified Caballeronia]MCE4547681.1 hypothetical protein [Caballeronia sp. PC1]MCE4575138.1 hypothetical protein [Caballeronia sp. CLC5]